MPNINLLPWREELREEHKRDFLIILVATIMATFILMVIFYLIVAGMVRSQGRVNTFLQQEIVILDSQIQEIQQLQETKQQLLNRMAVIQNLQAERPLAVRLFDEIVRIIPDGVYLNSIKKEEKKITLTGKAESNTRVSELMRNIEKSKWLIDPTLTEIKSDDKDNQRARDFQVVLMQKTLGQISPQLKPEEGVKNATQ